MSELNTTLCVRLMSILNYLLMMASKIKRYDENALYYSLNFILAKKEHCQSNITLMKIIQ